MLRHLYQQWISLKIPVSYNSVRCEKNHLRTALIQFVVRLKLLTTKELLLLSNQMEIRGRQVRTVCWVLQDFPTASLQFFTHWARKYADDHCRSNIPAIFHALGEEICGRSLSCSSRTC
ncbi:hypothetical protein AVEN_8388-1 [Araneus ventricosus]|uniref:Uncharacterized protein n=1 Tax=Araneus ventricosus TaxID=182803 RepID=A0A4Y2KEN5_ARAVE|nr:hypothetical protein AVEN_8388-1 [Araneus ventricosus]